MATSIIGTGNSGNLTSAQQKAAFEMGVGLFGISMGTTYLSAVADYLTSPGATMEDLYDIVLSSTVANSFGYYNYQTSAQFADKLVASMLPAGTSSAIAQQAKDAIVAMMSDGMSKGATAMAVIDFLSDTSASDATFGAAAKQLDNRVAVAEYFTLTKGNASTDLALLPATLSGVTNTTDISSAAKIDAILAAAADGIAAAPVLTMGTGMDMLTGNAADNLYVARIIDNANTLQSGDKISAGAGTDRLDADVGNSQRFAITAETDGVETIAIRAQAVSTDSTDNNTSITNEVQIDAQRMVGVTRWESNNSRADLLIEDVRILPGQITKDITIAMVETDPGHVDFGVYFDQYSLRTTGSNTNTINLEIMDTRSVIQGKDPLLTSPYREVEFTVAGKTVKVDSDAINDATTYAQLAAALNAAFATNANAISTKVVATVGTDYTRFDTDLGQSVAGKYITLTSSEGSFGLDVVWRASSAVPTSSGYHTKAQPPGATSSVDKVTSQIILDDVGRGSMGGDLVVGGLSVGDTSTSRGVERFEIDVYDSSKLQTINSTNNTLQEVHIENKTGKSGPNDQNWSTSSTSNAYPYHTAVTNVGNLTVTGEVLAGNNPSGAAGARIDAALPGTDTTNGGVQHNNFGFSDVRLIDASTMTGKLEFTAEITDRSIAKYLNLKDAAPALPATDNVAFVYTGGINNDTMTVVIDGAVPGSTNSETGREDFSFMINGGAGKDVINLNIGDNETPAWYIDQKLNANVSVMGGDGDDTITTTGYGDANISAGADNDTVYADNSGTVAATWVVSSVNTDLADLQSSLTNTGSHFLYNGKLKVTFSGSQLDLAGEITAADAAAQVNGWESEVSIPTGTNYAVTQLHINQAIKAAINNDSVLSKLLEAKDGPGNTLVITSRIDGMFDADDLIMTVSAPTTIPAAEQSGVLSAFKTFAANSAATIATVEAAQAASILSKNAVFGMDINQTIAQTGARSLAESDNTIDLGTGTSDVVVLGTGVFSNDTVVFKGYDLGKKTIVNFDDTGDFLNFNSYLTGMSSVSGSTESQVRIPTNMIAGSANSVTVNSTAVFTATDTFAGLSAAKLLAAINNTNTGTANYAGINAGTLDAVTSYTTSTPVTLVGGVGTAVVMIENSGNRGEYKVFELTFNGLNTNTTKDFTSVKEIAVIDLGASVPSFLSSVTTSASRVAGVTPGGAATPTYAVTASAASVNEGATASFNLVTTNVANGTVLNYVLSGTGVTTADTTAALTGTVTVNNNAATLSIAPTNDLITEGAETATLTIMGATANMIINDTSLTPVAGSGIVVAGNNTVPGTAANDLFTFDAVTALLDAAPAGSPTGTAGPNTQAVITGFATGDSLRIDMATANAAITTLAQLDGQQGVTVQLDPFAVGGALVVSFGADANGGEVVSLTLTGVSDAATVPVTII